MAVAYSPNTFQLNSYRTHSVLTLTPGEVIVKMYDIAVAALIARDGERACKVLVQLIDSLDFEYHEISVGLFRLYRYCMDEIKKGEFELPAGILRELRQTWLQALEQASEAASI